MFNLLSSPILQPMDSPTTAADTPRQRRHRELADLRRERVLDAARAAFLELGMDKTSIREVAHRAGYSPGAIYSYFSSKEELYAALLDESLQRLSAHVHAAQPPDAPAAARLRACARAFFDFYQNHPHDLDLGFYLFQGLKPRGLTPPLNTALNARLRAALDPIHAALRQLGLPADDALAQTTALFAHSVGLLLLSHTGRIRMFRQDAGVLLDGYVEQVLERVGRETEAACGRARIGLGLGKSQSS